MTNWQLSWNHKNYNGEARVKKALENPETYTSMFQSWGRSSTSNIAKIKVGDTIYISCKKKCIARAIVSHAFFRTTEIHSDEFIKKPDDHTSRNSPRWYCSIEITYIYPVDERPNLLGNQNTFCDPKKAFWKN